MGEMGDQPGPAWVFLALISLKKRTCADAVLAAGDGEPRLTGAVGRALDLATFRLTEESRCVGQRKGGGRRSSGANNR